MLIRMSIALLAVVFPAAAQEMPRYDVERHCDEVASIGGSPSEFLRNGCFRQEQAAYDQLKEQWADLPHAMRSHCHDVATTGGNGSYFLLNGCVRMEQRAANDNSGTKFRY